MAETKFKSSLTGQEIENVLTGIHGIVGVPIRRGENLYEPATADDLSAVSYTSQSLTSAEKAQARANIGASTGEFKVLGHVGDVDELPTNPKVGDAYSVGGSHEIYIFDGAAWFNNGAIVGAKGDKGEKGDKGDTGASPVRGVDYWTAADKQEIVDSARTALYSPVEYFDGTHALTAADVGKTLASSGAAENTVTLTTAISAAMPMGAEIAVFWMAGTSVRLQFTGTMRIVMPGEDVLVNGSLQLSKMFTLVALKKITTDAANGDIWTVQGDVEAVT